MTPAERRTAAGWAVAALVIGGLFMVGVWKLVTAGTDMWVVDAHNRQEHVRQQWLEYSTTTMPGVHYAEAIVAPPTTSTTRAARR